jgi:NADH dehydrogenase [ubiquinone] 1 alpha subcomplex assembly factor 5
MTDDIIVFDRGAIRHHRDRAAAKMDAHDFLFREVAIRLVDRLADINRRFPLAVDLGGHGGILRHTEGLEDRVDTLIETDLSPALAARSGGPSLAADEEFLPFANARLDLVISNLSLHWVNDLPGALVQIRQALKPDGLFLAAMLGGNTLNELRHALIEAEMAEAGGASPRLSPFAELSDAAGLLQRAGFALPVADIDTITVTYSDGFALMHDLRGMGEANAALERPKGFARRKMFLSAAERYAALYADEDGRIPATFQILYLTGWAPADTQQKPLRPGSATARLADALDTAEKPTGEKAGN